MIVKCRNGADLKQLAKNIAADGLRVQRDGNTLRGAELFIPRVIFRTKFDLKDYAKAKGLSMPFTAGQAEYAVSDYSIPYLLTKL